MHEGHRERLRKRFLEQPGTLTQQEQLELLLTYAIPRRDVAPIACELLDRYGTIQKLCAEEITELQAIPGLGEASVALLKLLASLSMTPPSLEQLPLFEPDPGAGPVTGPRFRKKREMRVFANDEAVNSLTFVPKVTEVRSYHQFREILESQLPYNSAETRRRRANYILERFFPAETLDTPLRVFLSHTPSTESLQAALFYHILRSEPAAKKVAEEYLYPALPTGYIEREGLREFLLTFLPQASISSLSNMLRSIFYTYSKLGVASMNGDKLRLRLHTGQLDALVYILTSEFRDAGIYTFEALFQGPAHRWLLWDKEWIQRQLYRLRDINLISKISQIDTLQQVTIAVDQGSALAQFYQSVAQDPGLLRDDPREAAYITP